MTDWEPHGETPNDTSLIQELRDTICGLAGAVDSLTQKLLIERVTFKDDISGLIQTYRETAMRLIKEAKLKYAAGSENAAMTTFMESEVQIFLKDYAFYTLMAHILESEKNIENAGKGLLSEEQLEDQIIRIIRDIEIFLEDPLCNKLNPEERNDMHLRWKKYIEKARLLDINISAIPHAGENMMAPISEDNLALQKDFDQIAACQGAINDFAEKVQAVKSIVTSLITSGHKQKEAITECKCALDEADTAYGNVSLLHEQTVDFTHAPIFGELDELKKNQYREVVQLMRKDITHLHSQYRFFGRLYQIESSEGTLKFLWEKYNAQSDSWVRMRIEKGTTKKEIHSLKTEIEHLKHRIFGEIGKVLENIDFVMGSTYFLQLSPERRTIYHEKLKSHQRDLKQIQLV